MTSSSDEQLVGNLRAVRQAVAAACQRAGRSPHDVTLVAVTKTVAAERVRASYAAGLSVFGENRVQEAEEKSAALSDLPLQWHMIGHLQSNKAGDAARVFAMIQSVDSVELAERLSRRSAALGRRTPVLLEINVAGEVSKFGFRMSSPADREGFLSAVQRIGALPGLDVQGLMTVAPMLEKPEQVRPYFRQLRELREWLAQAAPQIAWRHLSMGMSDDYVVAVEEGATMIRLGRALFGARRQ